MHYHMLCNYFGSTLTSHRGSAATAALSSSALDMSSGVLGRGLEDDSWQDIIEPSASTSSMPCVQEPSVWETIMPRQLATQLARLCKTECLPARAAAHAMLGALFQKTAASLPAPQAALLLSAVWHQVSVQPP